MDFSSRLPRHTWLAVSAFAIQFFVVKELSDPLGAKLLLGLSYAFIAACVLLNWRLVSFRVIGLGLALNVLAIYSNGGFMPIDPEAVRSVSLDYSSAELLEGARFGAKNILLDPAYTRFYALSDMIPTTFPRPMLYSVGDVVLAAGFALAVTSVARSGVGLLTGRSSTPAVSRATINHELFDNEIKNI